MPRVHDLKCVSPWFDDVLSGNKTFELRNNDRGYHVGDTLRLHEWDDDANRYTGRGIERTVSFVLEGTAHLTTGYAALGLKSDASEVDGLREQCSGAGKEMEVMAKEIAALTAERDSLIAGRESLRGEVDGLADDVRGLQVENAALKESLDEDKGVFVLPGSVDKGALSEVLAMAVSRLEESGGELTQAFIGRELASVVIGHIKEFATIPSDWKLTPKSLTALPDALASEIRQLQTVAQLNTQAAEGLRATNMRLTQERATAAIQADREGR